MFDGEKNNNVNYALPLLMNSFDSKMRTSSVLKQEYGCKAIGSGCEIYLLNQFKIGSWYAVKSYLSSTDSLNNLLSLYEEKLNYCICSFMGKLFVIGGKNKLERYDRPCVFYDKQSSIWHSFAPMIESRQNAACTVFEGKIVVSGGGL